MTKTFSVVISAHNEARVIRKCLETLLREAPADNYPEIVVVCNGCSDETAAIARSFGDLVTVLDLELGSKPLALNAGSASATAIPRFFLDADVTVDFPSLLATADLLRSGEACAAAPRIKVDTTGCDYFVRAYYRTWLTQPYILDNMVGSGLYGLSAAGLVRIGTIPAIISDDGFVSSRFRVEERRTLDVDSSGRALYFTVYPPRRVAELINIEGRRRAGDAELRALYPSRYPQGVTSLKSIVSAPVSAPDKLIYLLIKVLGRIRFRYARLRNSEKVWYRDNSSRQG